MIGLDVRVKEMEIGVELAMKKVCENPVAGKCDVVGLGVSKQ